MKIQKIKRPWEKSGRQGARYAPDPYYQSSHWKSLRESFRQTFTLWKGQKVSNVLCLECFKAGVIQPGRHTDHIVQRKAGGKDEHNNLQTLCDFHHASKSANEGKKFKTN